MAAIHFLQNFNMAVFIFLTVLYLYQFGYMIVGLLRKDPKQKYKAKKQHKYAAIICARNERAVIGDLVACLKKQKYPKDLLDVFVLADNCTDDTAQVARDAGAVVYTRHNTQLVGKSWALDEVFHHIWKDFPTAGYEAYMIFDADNLVDPNFVAAMNNVYDQGFRVITSYRNSKNYGTNWITAGYALWFLREARFLNQPRMTLNTNCAISGTGFLIADSILRANDGWAYHLLTEDIEFSIACAAKGEPIGYCRDAVIYDEQPTQFSQSWRQRLRWSKGFFQVVKNYTTDLMAGIVSGEHKSFSCYDMLMTIAPCTLLTLFCAVTNLTFLVSSVMLPVYITYRVIHLSVYFICMALVNFYLALFGCGLLTTIVEWKHIHTEWYRKILYLFTFPLFQYTYIPITIAALFSKKVEWKPIVHSVAASKAQI